MVLRFFMAAPILFALLGMFSLTAASGSTECTFDEISPSTTLTWCPCSNGFYCARLDVPLDYQNLTVGRASVPLVKYPAQSNSSLGAYQGIILVNPGGPGASGVNEVLNNGSDIQAIAGTNWDIIGFDPRGMWLSQPLANCSRSGASDQIFALKKKSVVPRLTDQYYNDQIRSGWELGEQCEQATGGEMDAGPHMSTVVTARDMLSIIEFFASTEDGKRASRPSNLLNYYGLSYGTFLGQTFASLFPESVGYMVLDGVVDPVSYLYTYTDPSLFHLDGIIAAFFIYCHEAGPSQCSFYTGSTPKDIYNRFNQSFMALDARKAQAENWANATDLEAALSTLKITILSAADAPLSSYWTSLPSILVDLESAIKTNTLSAWTAQVSPISGGTTALSGLPEWGLGVLCTDKNNILYNKTLADLEPDIDELERQSIIGEIWTHQDLGCTGWSIKATEIYQGPFGGDTATPILFVSNTYDPVTPIEDSISSAAKYTGAQVLTVDGMGHGISATMNLCGYAKVGTYFQTGELLGNDSFCALERGPWGVQLNGSLEENIRRAGLSDLQ